MNPDLVEMFSRNTTLFGLFGQVTKQPTSVAAVSDSPASIVQLLIVCFQSALLWAVFATAGGLCILLLRPGRRWQGLGAFLTVVGLLLCVLHFRSGTDLSMQTLFWMLASMTILSAVATIISRNPVYCAIWFALTLLGTAVLFLLHGAQFLGVATVVVYAGAIVVTFLFVVMLAQSGGQAHYDSRSWGLVPTGMATLAGAGFLAMVLLAVGGLSNVDRGSLRDEVTSVLQEWVDQEGEEMDVAAAVRTVRLFQQPRSERYALHCTLTDDNLADFLGKKDGMDRLADRLAVHIPELVDVDIDLRLSAQDVLGQHHMANLGGQLFARHLISVEVTGVLLLVALVGAVAIVIQGRQSDQQRKL